MQNTENEVVKIAPFGEGVEIGGCGGERLAVAFPIILVKFLFTNRNQLPPGIPEVSREDNAAMDRHHTEMAYKNGYGHLSAEGRVRENRVDTGKNFIKNLQFVHPGCLIRGLSNVGYHVTHCHWFFQMGEGGAYDKYVVVVGLRLNEDAAEVVKSIDQRRILAKTCWKWCHGWANPNGVLTLNFGGRQADAKPLHSVIIRDRKLTAARITEPVSEENE